MVTLHDQCPLAKRAVRQWRRSLVEDDEVDRPASCPLQIGDKRTDVTCIEDDARLEADRDVDVAPRMRPGVCT